ncbi:MAG TPA: hypothetical protein VNT53_03675 [Pseudolysinimonas sp.]|nr:hypothetical protein [Pseudolysinimonas sp.]
MADGLVAVGSGLGARLGGLKWWQQVLLVFLASRIVTTIIFCVFAALQPASERTGASPDYFTFATLWDGQWYWLISLQGYPTDLPHDAAGQLGENAWAFLPAYPLLMRVLTLGGLISFPALAPIVSTVFAAGAALVFFQIARRVLPAASALFAVVLLCVAPLSPILQASYAESMHLLLLLSALLLLLQRRYLVLIPVAIVMSLTRPSGLAFALLLLAHLIHRIATRRGDPFAPREVGGIVAAGLLTAAAGVSWIFVAWAVTGDSAAYTDTELVWRRAYIGDQHLLPFTSWFQGAHWWLSFAGVDSVSAWVLGAVLVTALVLAFGAFLFSPWAKRMGVDLRLWVAAYALYLLAVFFPQTSTFRLLVPLAPLLIALAVPRSRGLRVALVILGVVGQIAWMDVSWWVNGVDWTVP